MEGLRGKTALITGAAHATGLGRSCARRLAEFGCDIVLTDIAHDFPDFPEYEGLGRPEELAEGVAELASLGANAISAEMDVSDEDAVREAFAKAADHFGPVDILINNAAIRFPVPALDTTAAQVDKTFAVNVRGAFLCSREAASSMLQTGRGGRIVNIGSIASLRAMRDRTAYVASKFALIGLTQALAVELSAHNITVNAVCPGRVESGLVQGLYDQYAEANQISVDEAKQRLGAEHLPIGRLLQTTEVADAVAFLCSDHASGITGATLNVTGGEEVQLK